MERTKRGELCWIDLGASDLEAQTVFYEGLFGWTHVDTPTDMGTIYRQLHLGDDIVAGASQMGPEQSGMPSMWNLYACADDADAIAEKAAELGGMVIMPVMQVMDQGRLMAVADPSGGALFFWEPGLHNGSTVFGVPGSFGWADLNTRDPLAAMTFFSALLDWRIDELQGGPMPYWQITVDGVPEGGIMPMPPQLPAEVPSHWMIYFMVPDVAAAVERIRSLGGTVDMEPMSAGGVTFAVASDPQGATFAVMEQPMQA